MAIYKKRLIEQRLAELERYYLALRQELEGKVPGKGWATVYRTSEEDMVESYRQVDVHELLVKLEHFKAEYMAIKALKGQEVKPSK